MRPAPGRLAGALAATLVFAVTWLALYRPLPLPPGGDIYTSLGVARHLVAGDGLVNDTLYPVLTASDWGQTVPQPLIHRTPGLALLLVPAMLLAGGGAGTDAAVDGAVTGTVDGAGGSLASAEAVEALVAPTFLMVLLLLAAVGCTALWRRGQSHLVLPWLLLLLCNPLLAVAVRWGWSQVPAALLLLVLWLAIRRRSPGAISARAAVGYAGLSGILALVRMDLLWVPVLWWVVALVLDPRLQMRRLKPPRIPVPRRRSRDRGRDRETGSGRGRRRGPGRAIGRTGIAAAVGVAILLPWWLHVARHTGSPWTAPLATTVELDLDQPWWEYPRLRGREPVPLVANLAAHPAAAWHKVDIGLRGLVRGLGQWLPWGLWGLAGGLWLATVAARWRRGRPVLRSLGPPGLLWLTLGLLALQYALLSHEDRQLLPLLPVVAWEALLLCDRWSRRAVAPWRRRAAAAADLRPATTASLRAAATAAPTAVVVLALLLTPPGLGGEAGNVLAAQQLAPVVDAAVAAARTADLPAGPVFSDTAVVPWRLGRAFVWSPWDARVEAEIRAAVPALADAPWLRLRELAAAPRSDRSP